MKLTYDTLPYHTKTALEGVLYNHFIYDTMFMGEINVKMLYNHIKYNYGLMTPQIEEELFSYFFCDDLE